MASKVIPGTAQPHSGKHRGDHGRHWAPQCPKCKQNYVFHWFFMQFAQKHCFLQYIQKKPSFKHQVPRFHFKIRCQKWHGNETVNNTGFLTLGAQKTFKMGCQNQSKIVKKFHSGSPHVLPDVPKLAQGAKMVPRAPKWTHQASKIIVWGTTKMTTTRRCFENSHPDASEPAQISANKSNEIKSHTTKT